MTQTRDKWNFKSDIFSDSEILRDPILRIDYSKLSKTEQAGDVIDREITVALLHSNCEKRVLYRL